jgi:hypothetical protein
MIKKMPAVLSSSMLSDFVSRQAKEEVRARGWLASAEGRKKWV